MTGKVKITKIKVGELVRRLSAGQNSKSGNRSEKETDFIERCRDMTPEVLDQIAVVMREGKEADRLRAAGMILAYGWGRAPQTAALTDGEEATVNLFDPKKRQEIIDAAFERLRTCGAGTGQLRQ